MTAVRTPRRVPVPATDYSAHPARVHPSGSPVLDERRPPPLLEPCPAASRSNSPAAVSHVDVACRGRTRARGEVAGALVPDGAEVGDVLRAEADFLIDGIEILSLAAVKEKRADANRLEIIGQRPVRRRRRHDLPGPGAQPAGRRRRPPGTGAGPFRPGPSRCPTRRRARRPHRRPVGRSRGRPGPGRPLRWRPRRRPGTAPARRPPDRPGPPAALRPSGADRP